MSWPRRSRPPRGVSVLSPEATEALIQARHPKPGIGFDLTEKEREVLAYLVQGLSNSEISQPLTISLATVKYHLNNIFTKLGAKNRVEAATIASENKIVKERFLEYGPSLLFLSTAYPFG